VSDVSVGNAGSDEEEGKKAKIEIPPRDAVLVYLGVLQNLLQRPDLAEMLTDLERQALDFASCLLHQSIYGEMPEGVEELELRVGESESESESRSESKAEAEEVENARSVYDLAIMRRRDGAEQ